MAIVTDFVTGTQPHHILGGYEGYLYNEIDFSVKNVSNGDTVQLLKTNSSMVVKDVIIEIITPQGGVATATIGDGDDPDGYDASVDLNAAAGTFTSCLKGTDAYANGRRYAADDTIDAVVAADLDTAKIKVWAPYMRMK